MPYYLGQIFIMQKVGVTRLGNDDFILAHQVE
jgi:hypothetical protein